MTSPRTLAVLCALLLGCASTGASKPPALLTPYEAPRMAEPEVRPVHGASLIRNGRVMTAAGRVIEHGHVLVVDGRIAEVGEGDGVVPSGGVVFDANKGVITPGLIDTHSHLGVYAMPSTNGTSDGNEATNPVTAHVRSEDGFFPQDPGIWRALSGGVTTIQVLPGSANVIAGRSFVAHLRPGVSARSMKFPGAPEGIKMACGENPKGVYGEMHRDPSTRMGVMAMMRASFQKALEYRRAQAKWQRDLAAWRERQADEGRPKVQGDGKPDDPPEPVARDFGLETLVGVLEGRILVHNHCYRADEMSEVLDLAHEFGFHVRSFHHALEAYKIADRLAAEGVAVSTWVDWWGYKMEALDGVPQNASMVFHAGGRPILHSDSATEMRRLNQEAAKARAAGEKFGIAASDDDVLKWVTANPAWALGLEKEIGTLEVGKRADLVVWNGSPFSVYSLAQTVFIDGEVIYDRAKHQVPISDFELGSTEPGDLP